MAKPYIVSNGSTINVLNAISKASNTRKPKVPYRDVGSFAFLLDRVETQRLVALGCEVKELTPEMTTPDDFNYITTQLSKKQKT